MTQNHQHTAHASNGSPDGNGKQSHGAHVDHTGHELLFRNRFWICLALSIPVLLYSPMIQMWLGYSLPSFPGSHWIGPVFATIVFVIGGIPD